jgi:GNAT superfamily N-acetyltransferase
MTGTENEEIAIVMATDPRRAELESHGWTLVSESWGARLRLGEPPDLVRARAVLERALATGVTVGELGPEHAGALHRLETANHADYPQTPATGQELLDEAGYRALWEAGRRVFGAVEDGRLVGAAVAAVEDAWAETEFLSVLADRRGRGIGAGIAAAVVLTLAGEGVRTFAAGGAAVNAASLAASGAVGYVVEEWWHSYRR